MSAVATSMPPLVPLLGAERSEQGCTHRIRLRPRVLAYHRTDRATEEGAATNLAALSESSMAEAHTTFLALASFVPPEASYLSPPPRGTLPEALVTPLAPGRSNLPASLPDPKKRRKLEYTAKGAPKNDDDRSSKTATEGPRLPLLSEDAQDARRQVPQIPSKMTAAQKQRIEYMRRLASHKSSVALGSQQAANYGACRPKGEGTRKRTGVVARCA